MRVFYAPRALMDNDIDKSGSAAAYELLGYAIRQVHGLIVLPKIEKTSNGKPYFPDADIFFSLSHSRTHVLCAVSDFPVGADIESARKISGRAVRYFASPDELALFDPLGLWVLKESYVKLIGATLPAVKTVRFSMSCGIIIPPDSGVSAKLYGVDGCRIAVCSRGGTLPDVIEPIA